MFDAVVRAGVRLLGVAALWLALPACSTTSPDGGGRRERPAEEGALGTVAQAIGTASGDCTSAVFGSEVYYFCADARSWADARARCLSTPGLDLARIDGAGENAFVTSGMGGESWISANDRAIEGAWRWSTNGADDGAQFWSGNSGGAPVGGLFANWEPGQPNDVGTQDCGIVETNGKWDDKTCTDAKRYVCEGDACPSDPNKLEPGVCGCGVSDVDTDGDGRADCQDLCPRDPFKVAPGDCGCSDDPVSAGVPCADGLCAANTTCDGAGSCGSPAACAPDPSCTFQRAAGRRARGYFFCTAALDWTAARAKCQTVPGADLARIDDASENAYVASLIGGDAWLGANDRQTEGDWFWAQPGSNLGDQFWDGVSGGHTENGLYANWASGQPDNANTGDCGLVQASGAKWADVNCGSTARFVCEIPPAPSSGLQAGAPWPTGSQSPGREGRSAAVGAQTSDLNWSVALNGTTPIGPPIVGAGERIYVAAGARFFAVSPGGTVAWSFDAAGAVHGAAAVGHDGRIYFGSESGNDGRLYALSPAGQLLWKFDVDDPIESAPALDASGAVYFTEGHHVYALDHEGHQKWRFHVGDNDGLAPAITGAGSVLMGSNGVAERMRALSPTGVELWAFNPGTDVSTTAMSARNGTVYFAAGTLLFALDRSGAELWRSQLGAASTSPLALGPDGTIYGGSVGGRLRAFAPASGATKWTALVGSELTGAPAVGADGVVYVTTQSGLVDALRPVDGSVFWSRTVPGALASGPAVGASGTVYVGGGDGKLYSIGGNPTPFVHCVTQVSPGRFAAAFGYENPTPVTLHVPRGNDNRLIPGSTPPSTAIAEDFAPGRKERAFWELFDGTTTLSWVLRGRTAAASRFSPQCKQSDFPQPVATKVVPTDPERPSANLSLSLVQSLGADIRNTAHGVLLPDPASGATGTSSPPGGIGRIQQALVTPGVQVPFTFRLTSLFPSTVNVGFCDSPDINARVTINGQACGSVEVATCDEINVDGCCPGIICKACGMNVEAPISYTCSQNLSATDPTVQVDIHLDEDGDDVMNKTLTIDLATGNVVSPAGVNGSIVESPGGWGVAFDFTATPKPTLPTPFKVCGKWNASFIDEGGTEDQKGTPAPGQAYAHFPASFAEVTLHVQSPLGEARWGAEYDGAGTLISGTPLFLDADGCLGETQIAQPVEFRPVTPNQPLAPKELFLFVNGAPAGNPTAGGLRAEMWLVSRMRRIQNGDQVDYGVFDVETGFRSQDPLSGDDDNDLVPDQFELRLKRQHRHVESAHMTTTNAGIPLASWTQQGFWAVPPATIEVSAPEWHTNVTRTSAVIGQMLAKDDMYFQAGNYEAHAYDGCPGDDFQSTSLVRDSCMSEGVLYIGPEDPPPNPVVCTTDANCPSNQVCIAGLCSWVQGSRWKFVVAHEAGHQIENRARGNGSFFGVPYTFACDNPDKCPNQAHDPGNPDVLQDPFGTDVRCRCDHVQAANGLHCLNSIERGTDAFTEGFAQFMAAKTWNRRDDADCSFTYYKEYMEADFSVRAPPLAIDCANPVRWRNHFCPMNDLDSTTPQEWADFSTERDWLGFLRATNALSVDRSSLKDLFDAGRVACHTNRANLTPCTFTDIGWDPLYQRDGANNLVIGADGFGVPVFDDCSHLHPTGNGFTCDAQDFLRDRNGQLVVTRGGLRDGAERLFGTTATKYVHFANMGRTYGVDTTLAP